MMDFERQYRMMFPQVVRSVRRIIYDKDTAEDVAQTAFLKAWEARDKYNPNKGDFMAWMNTISTRLALQESEKRGTKKRFLEKLSLEVDLSIPATQEKERLTQQVIERIDSLPDYDKNIIYMHVLEDVSFKTLGEIYGMSTDYMWKRFKKVIREVRDGIEAQR